MWYRVLIAVCLSADVCRYYIDDSTDILWEEWFHCDDLGTQLGPVIKK